MAEATLHLTAAVTHEGAWYVARCLQVEVTSQGASFEEAMANLGEPSSSTSKTNHCLRSKK
jgi:predicted RNase H-like HicB family nuclease